MWYAVTMKIHVTEVEIESIKVLRDNLSNIDEVVNSKAVLPLGSTTVSVACKNGYVATGVFKGGTITTNKNYTIVQIVLDECDGEVTIEGRYYGKV